MVDEQETTRDSNIPSIIIRIGEPKQSLRVEGLGNIHPLYEALIGLFRKQIPETAIVQRYAKDEGTLKATIVTESILERLNPKDKSGIIRKFNDGETLENIVSSSALSLAENQRSADGKVLRGIGEEHKKNKYFRHALKIADPLSIYVEESQFEKVRERALGIKIGRRLLYVATLLIGMYAAFYLTKNYYEHKNLNEPKKTENLQSTNITSLTNLSYRVVPITR